MTMQQRPLSAEAARPVPLQRLHQQLAVAAVLSSMALVVLDASMMNTAMPTIADTLNIAPDKALRLVSFYQAAILMALFPCSAIGESLGYRRTFLAGVLLFTAAAAVTASTSSFALMVAARFVQGLGGAAIMALGVALLRQALPAPLFGSAIGWNALTVALCSALGPTLAAVVLAAASWKWLLVAPLPLAAFALFASRGLPRIHGTRRPVDLASMALSASGFAALMFGVGDLTTSPTLAGALLLAALLSFWILVRRELPKAAPLIPVDLLGNRTFRLSVVASVCCFAGQTVGLLALPFYLQHEFGTTPLMTGLYMTLWPLAAAAGALASGRLIDRSSPSSRCAAGGGLLAIGLALAAATPAGSELWLAAVMIPCGLGFGLFQVPNNQVMFLSAPIVRSAAAGGIQGTARLTGQTFGSVLLTLLFVSAPRFDVPQFALAGGAIFAFSAAMFSLAKLLPRNAITSPA
jgi:DHA2 family multidrug resistance protein-like MFS transporter